MAAVGTHAYRPTTSVATEFSPSDHPLGSPRVEYHCDSVLSSIGTVSPRLPEPPSRHRLRVRAVDVCRCKPRAEHGSSHRASRSLIPTGLPDTASPDSVLLRAVVLCGNPHFGDLLCQALSRGRDHETCTTRARSVSRGFHLPPAGLSDVPRLNPASQPPSLAHCLPPPHPIPELAAFITVSLPLDLCLLARPEFIFHRPHRQHCFAFHPQSINSQVSPVPPPTPTSPTWIPSLDTLCFRLRPMLPRFSPTSLSPRPFQPRRTPAFAIAAATLRPPLSEMLSCTR